MTVSGGTVIPLSQIRLGVESTLRGSLARLATGRVLLVDYFAGRRCSVVIGDLTADFRDAPTRQGYVELASIAGVRVFAAERLLAVLGDAGPTLRLAGPPFARHLAIRLDRPERWMEFLEGPGVLAGTRQFRWGRR
ncbi:MAG: hypothetical protein QOJ75_1838 [Chloroflexota bacterium]|nr:hypothetical protein [Chloroflexota bacterium]